MGVTTSKHNVARHLRAPVRAALADLRNALDVIYGSAAPTCLLYGSQARGDARPDSDVDVILIFSGEIDPAAEILRLGQALAEITINRGVVVAVRPIASSHYREATGPFWQNVKQDGIILDV